MFNFNRHKSLKARRPFAKTELLPVVQNSDSTLKVLDQTKDEVVFQETYYPER